MNEGMPLPDNASLLERFLDGIHDEAFEYPLAEEPLYLELSIAELLKQAYRAGARDAAEMMGAHPVGLEKARQAPKKSSCPLCGRLELKSLIDEYGSCIMCPKTITVGGDGGEDMDWPGAYPGGGPDGTL